MTKKILIVNDEEDVAEVTKDMLEAEGYEVSISLSGEDALLWLNKNLPDLILLDLLLTGIQGEEVCKKIKLNNVTKNIPIILLSANAVNIEKVVNETGADGFLTIPYDPDDMLKKIKTMIG